MHHTVNVSRARFQHAEYCRVLSELGIEIIKIPKDDGHPDSCFVEDNAVVHSGRALICRMAKESRRGEEEGVEAILKEYMHVRRATAPATIEGGDVIHLPARLICGVTQRTNLAGVEQIREWLDLLVDTFEDSDIVHIKSYATYLGRGVLISTKEYASHPTFEGLHVLTVPEGEEYAADTLAIGDTVLMPEGLPEAHKMVREAGFDVIPLDVGEFEKCEGALTCLSILF
jgi:dimethylargininase